jgi:hypothetical protein
MDGVRPLCCGHAQDVFFVVFGHEMLDAGAGEERVERLQVLVRCARAAVQQQDLDLRIVAGPLGSDVECPGWRFNGNHPDAAGEDVLATRVVERRDGPQAALLAHIQLTTGRARSARLAWSFPILPDDL